MDNIVMVPLSGPPMADGITSTASGAGQDSGFGAVLGAELALLAGTGKNGKKSAAGNADESLAAMLLATMIGFYQNGQQADETAADTAEGGVDAAQTVSAQQTTDGEKDGKAGIGALMRLFGGSGDAHGALTALLAGGKAKGAVNELIRKATAEGGQQFTELLAALQGGAPTGESSGAGNVKQNEGSLNALKEIRDLFAEIVSKMENGAGQVSAAEAIEAGGAAMAPGKLTKALLLEALDRIDKQIEGAEGTADATAERPVMTLSLQDEGADTAQGGEAELNAGTDAASMEQTTPVGRRKEPADFTQALRAYRGDATGGASAAATPAENSAAMALRQGGQAFDAIVDKISSMQTAGQKELEIRLKPDFLGHVVIKLTMGESGLTASIAASNPKVQDAFLSQASALQNSLMEQGIKDVRVVVTSSSVQDAALQQQHSGQGHGQGRQEKQRRHVPAITELGGAAASQPLLVYEQTYRTGLVNRLA